MSVGGSVQDGGERATGVGRGRTARFEAETAEARMPCASQAALYLI